MNLSALTQTQAAALLSVAPRTLRDWHDAPRNPDSTYNGPALVAYYVSKVAGGGDSDDQRQRLAAAQAEKVEHENAIRRGELAQKADVVQFWTDCIANMRAKALALGPKLSPRLVNIADANLISAAVRAEVHAFLAELVDFEPRRPVGMVAGGEAGGGAPADADGERVVRPGAKVKQRKQRGARAVAD